MARGSYLRSLISGHRDVPALQPQHVPIWGRQPGEFGGEVVSGEAKHDRAGVFFNPRSAEPLRTPVLAPAISAEVALTGTRYSAMKAAPIIPSSDTPVSPAAPATSVEVDKSGLKPLPAVSESGRPRPISVASSLPKISALDIESSLRAQTSSSVESLSREVQIKSGRPFFVRKANSYLQEMVSGPVQSQGPARPQSDASGFSRVADIAAGNNHLHEPATEARISSDFSRVITPFPPAQLHQLVSSTQAQQKQLGNSVRIGSIDIHIAAPPPAAAVRQQARPRMPVVGAAISRGFTSSFGLNQG